MSRINPDTIQMASTMFGLSQAGNPILTQFNIAGSTIAVGSYNSYYIPIILPRANVFTDTDIIGTGFGYDGRSYRGPEIRLFAGGGQYVVESTSNRAGSVLNVNIYLFNNTASFVVTFPNIQFNLTTYCYLYEW